MVSPNRQYESMLTVARERLSRHAPESIARRAGVTWDGGRLTLPSLGQTVTVTVPDFAVSPELDMWHALTLLHYLDLADGTPLLGKMMAFAQYPDGMVRGGGFDRRAELVIRRQLGLLPPEELRRRCLALGAELLPSNADLCAPLPPVAAAVVRGRGISRVGTAVSGRERRPLPDGGGCGNGGRPAAGAAGRRPSTGLEERSGYAQICSDPGFLQGHAVLS